MGIYFFDNKSKKGNLSLIIDIEKSCYYPGEIIAGKIILQVKNNKIPSVFNFTKAYISITQIQQNQLLSNNMFFSKNIEKKIYIKKYNFKQYKKRPIIVPLSITFSIKTPNDLSPTLLYENNNFIKHFLTIYFPKNKAKKSIGIIIQNVQKFLYKEISLEHSDIHYFINFKKNKIFSYYFNTEKNSYAYNERIPYEIIVNFLRKEFMKLNLRISLTRKIYFSSNDKIDSKLILFKNYCLNFKNDQNIFKISGYFQFPVISDYFSVNPMSIYNYYNNKLIDDYDKDYEDIILLPTCFSSFYICSYFLNLEIISDSFFSKNEIISIPIELFTPLKSEDNEMILGNDNSFFKKEETESLINKEDSFMDNSDNVKLN